MFSRSQLSLLPRHVYGTMEQNAPWETKGTIPLFRGMRMGRVVWLLVLVCCFKVGIGAAWGGRGLPHQILLDTDVDTDDFFALLYLLKLNRSEFNLKAVTINANSWTNAGHSVNHVYDILYMMDRDDIPVGVGGEGGILPDGTILPNVGGYLPIIEQGNSTAGGCRYRQFIPIGQGGRLDIDTNYGIRRGFLPQGHRNYSPLRQPTAQQVMVDAISAGPITVFLIGVHTNFAIFLMKNPHLKKNIEHIYIMGGGVGSRNQTGCCPKNASSSCKPQHCSDPGNLFTGHKSNPYAEFNIFGDPFAAYQVLHSGIPITLVPLEATNTIPINEGFFTAFGNNQDTYEAQYCFQSLKMIRDTLLDNQFYTNYFMWDSFAAGVAVSIMLNKHNPLGENNEFADMEYQNITIITSNKPYGISDGSNPFFDDHVTPKFNLQNGGVHSGHVQVGLQDPFCLVENGKGKCEDGYTKEVSGPDSVRVLVAKRAKPNRDNGSPLDREFFRSFLDVLNLPQQTGRFNFTTQFPYYNEILFRPDFSTEKLGMPVVFDMDMSAGDFLALIYLLKVPVKLIDLKAILVSGNGWANAATIDIIYDILHMMGRDDIPVGLGSLFALDQPDPSFSTVGDCKYIKAIPHGSGGFLDSNTLFGLSRSLPRSPRRYTAENSVDFGAPKTTDHPELRQPLALENVYIVGGHISDNKEKGNLFTIPTNEYAEFNMFLDPLAAKTVLDSDVNITLIPLSTQQKVTSFSAILKALQQTNKTPEAVLTRRLLSRLYHLQQKDERYHHMSIFLGEILGAVILANDHLLNPTMQVKPITLLATADVSEDGQIVIDWNHGKLVNILDNLDPEAYYDHFSNLLGSKAQSAVIGSFYDQKRVWSRLNKTE
ncbi:Inosine-uridine preferring nucleoside hydrolase family protein isoform 1 [Cinnamomum micranthum f. kanehirae]|uniref:Inosine-uridine preferring nucleoside hydrolase family protein isoform 1 n=1 Tax=Cinnamomum micranthum f. kanehirae TaxID=337451 RepID=A0A3S3NSV8_9MAGN|nr:Inosine-uridine preferring nucleoside hydrolase family protein isoform 1 [Cinnamomum micranthum f. kanehirae]